MVNELRQATPGPKDRPSTPVVQSVARAARIMGVLLRSAQGIRMTDLAKRLDLSKATTHRLLHTLELEGVVRQCADTGRYSFNPAAFIDLGSVVSRVANLRAAIEKTLVGLSQQTAATAVLTFPDETRLNAVVGAYALSPRPLRLDPSMLPPMPAHQIAPGKCCLAALPEAKLAKVLPEQLAQATEFTIRSVDELLAELAKVRRQGYAVCEQEGMRSICGLAVPVHDRAGTVVAGLALAHLGHSMSKDLIRRWLPSLRTTADAVSQLLQRPEGPALTAAAQGGATRSGD